MEMKSSGKRCSSLKGFTLIELIVVIAIMGVLMAMLSLAITGFTNDAKREAADEQARMVSQSFQSLLTEYEIRGITLDNVTYKDSTTGVTKLFYGSGGTLPDELTLWGDSSIKSISRNGGQLSSEGYEIITKNFEPGFQGSFCIKYDSFSYSVKYVLYTPKTSGTNTNVLSQVFFAQLVDRDEQKSILRNRGIVIGCYPYSDDMA